MVLLKAKSFTLFVLFALVVQPALAAGDDGEPRNAIVTNAFFIPNMALSGLTGKSVASISVEYQRAIGSAWTLAVVTEAINLNTHLQYDEQTYEIYDGWGGELMIGLRYLFSENGLTGWFLSAYAGAGWIDGGYRLEASSNIISGLLDAGYAHSWKSGFTMGFGLGLSCRFFFWHNEFIDTTSVISPWTRLDIGFAW